MAKKMLVVDDSRIMRLQVGHALREAGYGVVEAHDGLDGLAQLRANPGIAMVICDVNMPRMNGLEMVEVVMQSSCKDVPILMLTTDGHPALVRRAAQAGAKGWIVKPFKPVLLIAAIQKLVGPP